VSLRSTVLTVVIALACVRSIGRAQAALPATKTVNVDSLAMRVRTSGIEQRKPGQPVVILEAGAGSGLDTWNPVFAEIARLAAVIAYDRRGLGQSEPDREPPTIKRVGESLHALLKELGVPPPYILVGHSWGGILVRGFWNQYSTEVAGLVCIDVTDFESTREEKAAALPPADRQKALAPPDMPPIPVDTPPGLRAEIEVLRSEMLNDGPSVRALREPRGIPIAVVVSAPPVRVEGNSGAMVRLQIKHQTEWALTSPNGIFIVADHVGHMVHRDDPTLVARLVEHVLKHVPPK
jgi:pimeloyl-ACP methyl ester carboxylesterase